MHLDQDFEQLSTERPTTSGTSPEQVLHEVFGYETFRPLQGDIIREVSEGRDALVLMPTGGGKSLCYQVPALVRPGTAIVISTLIALMQDQVAALKELGVKAAFLNSTMDFEQARATEYALMTGELDLLYCAPERLIQPRTIELLHNASISLVAIDEAHCVSQWGHDFRSDYLQLSMLAEAFPGIPRIALTATADERTRKEIAERLSLTTARHFVSGFDRPNIQYRIAPKTNANSQLLSFIKAEHEGDCGIVYCLSRNKVDATARTLAQKGYTALPYHAGLSSEQRAHHQERFLREDGVIIVATIAFGMGIDKPDVRFVAHLDLPKSLEGYYQEIGRAGRDGLPANAWMTYGLGDVVSMRRMLMSGDSPDGRKTVELQKLDALLGYCESTACRHQIVLRYFGEAHPGDCGQCDNCLTPVDTWDATQPAQMALSCVYRTGQRFGVAHLIDVLLGKETPKVAQFGHTQLSTFGIGKALGQAQWSSVYRQLAASGLLNVDMEAFGGLKLTDLAKPVLRGEQSVWLRRDAEPVKRKASKIEMASRLREGFADASEDPLWQALKAKRLELAREQAVPPYVIFHDSTLLEIFNQRPSTPAEFGQISGVGQAKLVKYADHFLEVLNADKR